jgi:DNA-binding response OmpR family regulator
MSGETCPCCGQTIPANADLRIDPAGIVVRQGRFAVLTRQEHTIFEALNKAFPKMRTREQLLTDLYWDKHEEPEIKIIDVFVCKLRKKLKPLGVVIHTIWGQGYRLQVAAIKGEAA